jgi:hypothetical protein
MTTLEEALSKQVKTLASSAMHAIIVCVCVCVCGGGGLQDSIYANNQHKKWKTILKTNCQYLNTRAQSSIKYFQKVKHLSRCWGVKTLSFCYETR